MKLKQVIIPSCMTLVAAALVAASYTPSVVNAIEGHKSGVWQCPEHPNLQVTMDKDGKLWAVCGSCGTPIPLRYSWGTNTAQARIEVNIKGD